MCRAHSWHATTRSIELEEIPNLDEKGKLSVAGCLASGKSTFKAIHMQSMLLVRHYQVVVEICDLAGKWFAMTMPDLSYRIWKFWKILKFSIPNGR